MKTLYILSILFIVAFSACKKSYNDGVICNGNGTTSYYPVAVGNSRHFKNNGNEFYDSIFAQSGVYFFKVSVQPGYAPSYDTLRIANNGDLFDKSQGGSTEFLLMPAAPQVGQAWSNTDMLGKTYYKKITSLNKPVATSYCLYTHCMELQDSLDNNNVRLIYYAPGIGQVLITILVGPASTTQLSGLILK